MNEKVAYAPSFMPEFEPRTSGDGTIRDQQMIDHMMRSASINREQAMIMLNCLYQTIQHNLCVSGKFEFKKLMCLETDTNPGRIARTIKTSHGIIRNYNAKPPSMRIKANPTIKLKYLLSDQE
jgi:nucleoid DNA-binding protein